MAMQHPRLYAAGGWLMRMCLRAVYGLGLAGSILDPMRVWNRYRSPVPLPPQSFRALWKQQRRNERAAN
jgi:hypothetical protein